MKTLAPASRRLPGNGPRSARTVAGALLLVALATRALADEAPAPGGAAAARVLGVTPAGDVKEPGQVTVTFSTPMIALGDPRAADPVTVACSPAAEGRGRWADTRRWVFDFGRKLPGGVRCRIAIVPGLRDLAGSAVVEEAPGEFATGGPQVVSSQPVEGATIDEEQAFALDLDAEATRESIEAHAWLVAEGIPEKIGVTVADDATRDAVRTAIRSEGSWWDPQGPVVVLLPKRRLPAGAKVQLVWGEGIAARSGIATGAPRSLEFTVRPALRGEVRCQRESARAGCIPITSIFLSFSAPVAADVAAKIALVGPDGTRFPQATPDDSDEPTVARVRFRGPFPPRSSLRLEIPADLRDGSGRSLENLTELRDLPVAVDGLPPLAKFGARLGLLEARGEPLLPVAIRGLEPEARVRLRSLGGGSGSGASGDAGTLVQGRVRRLPSEQVGEILRGLLDVAWARRDRSVFGDAPDDAVSTVALPRPDGEETQMVGLPLPGPGVYVVELASTELGRSLLGSGEPMYVQTAAVVTDLAVHFERGVERSLAWVTSLEKGKPVADAEVSVHDCAGTVLATARTGEDGLAWFDRLPPPSSEPSCKAPASSEAIDPHRDWSSGLMGLANGLVVTARLGDDLGLVSTSWNEGIDLFRFDLPWVFGEDAGSRAHTVLARNLLRAGETAHMKHFLRAAVGGGLALLPPAERPTTVVLRHDGSGTETTLPLAWAADGSATTDWAIPREAKLGLYRVVLRRPDAAARDGATGSPTPAPTPTPRWPYESSSDATPGSQDWETGEFRVEEFRVPLLKTTLRLPSGPEVAPREVAADLASSFMAGGVAKGLPVVVRSRVSDLWIEPPASFKSLRFGGGPVAVGVERSAYGSSEEEPGEGEGGPEARGVFRREELRLDETGSARVTIADVPVVSKPAELQVEAEVRDPNGESQTTSSKVQLWPASRIVGIRADADPKRRRRGKAEIAVLDTKLAPVAGARVDVDLFEQRYYTSRQRVVGGFYSFRNVTETRRVGSFCHGRTDAEGRLHCRHSLPAGQDFLLQARTRDDQGRTATATSSIWLPGDDGDWNPQTDDDRMDVIPERKSWEPGETAKFRARVPFREATTLVSVVREGVLDAKVVTLGRADGTFEVPIRPSHSPNVFVHALAVRGRVASIRPTSTLDLGKPAFRLGIASIDVGWTPHRLDVKVEPEREAFRPREKARVRIAVRGSDGRPPERGTTVAVAAIDEGLLQLLPNGSWKLLEAMMSPRGDRVETSTSMLHVVGRRHFGKKARPDGGGGGQQPTREMFDTLLLWRGSLALDRDGRAEVEVPLNDSLTAFRIAAVAAAGTGRFGTGEATIRSTQDLMLLPGLPPVVRGGDRFAAPVTVRNASERPLDVAVRARADGLASPDLGERTMRLEPGESRVATWEVDVPAGIEAVSWQVDARASGGAGATAATDRLTTRQRVVPSVPVRTLQATLEPWSPPGPLVEPVAAPAGAVAGAGGVEVGISPSLGAGLDGVRAWMREYPYSCLEQRVSRAVALEDPALWKDVSGRLSSLQDGDGLLRFFPSMQSGSVWLTGYVLDVAGQARLALPEAVEAKMRTALRSFVEGNLRAGEGSSGDLLPRKLAAVAALCAGGQAADPALLSGVAVEPALWPTRTVLDWWQILRRSPGLPDRDARLREAQDVLRSRLDLSGTTLAFATDPRGRFGDGFGGEDVDALRLLVGAVESGAFADEQGRLMRGALSRQKAGAWAGTVANAYGTIATRRFVAAHESDPVAGTTVASLDGTERSVEWAKDPGGRTLSFPWPAARADLAIEHRGSGRPWTTIRTRAAVPLAEPLSAGFRIRRTVEAIERRSPDRWSVGDSLRVRVEVDASSEQGWTVVDDPVPPGATFLARGFSTDSALAAPGGTPAPGIPPTFEERTFEGFRAYFETVGAGRLAVEYSIRLNQAGIFQMPPTHVEALYAPEVMAESPNPPIEVVE